MNPVSTASSASNHAKAPWPLTAVVGVLCGGWSSERDVSLRSGHNCLAALHRLGYANAQLIDVAMARQDQPAFMAAINTLDVALLTLHGAGGEDGAIQGFLTIMGIPFTGNGIKASALTMDKVLTKHVLAAYGLPVLPTLEVDTQLDPLTWPAPQQWPVMVKPLGEGSSIGMQKVNTPDALAEAIAHAGQYSQRVMIEPYVTGLSVTVGVIQQPDGSHVATPILGFKTKTEWYDLTAKYTPGLTEFLLPAPLTPALTQYIQTLTLKAHHATHCSGVSRIDWMIDEQDNAYILEVNTIPGMTDLSDLPAQAGAMGMGYDALVHALLHTAVPVAAPSVVRASTPSAVSSARV
jgi:D-alanine-D-alanine ligase